MNVLLFIVAVIGLLILYIWSMYNGLIALKMRVKEAWSQIDVQLKRRSDLIPNLVETVKGYAKHEKSVFEDVTRARSALLSAKTPAAKASANNQLAATLKSLFAVAEAYPELRASENFSQLQRELEDTEDKVAYSRQFYNTAVMDYNLKIKIFPNVLIAQQLGFAPEEFFTAEEEAKEKINVKFD